MVIPVFASGVLRRDLVIHMARMALISLPFAFTEFMFYPDYWDPPFLFDAAMRFGFGLEDFLFVAALGAMSIGLYPALARKQLQRVKPQAPPLAVLKIALLIGAALLAAVAGWVAEYPAIYTGLVIMIALPTILLLTSRPDLRYHACMSGGAALSGYVGVCMALELILPGTFGRYWHTDDLLNAFAGPLPVEELLYGFSAGFSAAVIYPFAFGLEFRRYSELSVSKIRAWIQASRLPSQGYIFCPLLLGQAFWFSQSGTFNLPLAALTWLFGLMIQLYIVYANDLADVAIDRLNATFTPFSGGSRVLVEGKLTVSDLKRAVAVTVLFNGLIGLCLLVQGRPLAPWLILISLALLWLYSFPPVRLSYRGGGEILQMAGVGLILPIFGYYVQAGSLEAFPWRYVAALLPLQLACAFSTTLPDEPSDRAGGKKTIAVILGGNRTKAVILALHLLTLILLAGVILSEHQLLIFLSVSAVSMAAISGLILSRSRAVPGSRSMLVFVTCSILATLGLTTSIAIERFVSARSVQSEQEQSHTPIVFDNQSMRLTGRPVR